jgi:hypothetical protein
MNLDGGEQEFLETQHMGVQEARAAESPGPLSTHGVSSLNRGLWAIRATPALVGGFPLLAVLVYVANEYPAFEASTHTLKASVVGLYGVVILAVGVYPCCVHSDSSFLWAGLRGVTSTCGAIPLFVTIFYYCCKELSSVVI